MKTETACQPNQHLGSLLNEDEPVVGELEFLYKVSGQDGRSYKLYQGGITQSPVVRSCETGKYFILPWPDVVRLAVDAGVDRR